MNLRQLLNSTDRRCSLMCKRAKPAPSALGSPQYAMYTPSNVASESVTPSTTIDDSFGFHHLGGFNLAAGRGPARSLPPELRALQLGSTWTVEFNRVSDLGDPKFYKNRITSRVPFTTPYVGNKVYHAAMVSMEVSPEYFEVIDNDEVSTQMIHIEQVWCIRVSLFLARVVLRPLP